MIFRLLLRFWKKHPLQAMLMFTGIILLSVMWVMEPLYSSYAVDQLMMLRDHADVNVVRIFVWWGVVFFSLSAVQTFEKYVGWQIDNMMLLERREEVYRHVLNLDIAFHTKQKSGEIIKQLDEGADNLVDLQRNLVIDFGPSLLSAIAFLGIGLTIHPILALILIGSLIAYLGVAFIGTNRTYKLQYAVNKLWVQGIGRAFDAATNIFSVKSNAKHEYEMKLMRDSHEQAYTMQQRVNMRWAAVEAINFFMLTRILLVGVGILLYVRGAISLGQLYFFQFSFYRVLTPFEMIAGMLPQWNKRAGKVRMAQMILETPIEVTNKPDAIIPASFKGQITFEGVCFTYRPAPVIIDEDEEGEPSMLLQHLPEKQPEEERTQSFEKNMAEGEVPVSNAEIRPTDDEAHHEGEVLHDINLIVHSGEHIAFVGHSGAGKSTLATLLNRFYDVTAGKILIDGIDLRDLDMHWWRSQVGLVLQENIMFNDSILNNIRYARPEATVEEVREAAQRAAAAEFIDALPEKYETMIGDRGIRLSGGQRQRVAIARAILKQPKVIVLDEATSALDSVTERKVQEGIKELIKGRTSFIIAHRLSTVRTVDRIAVIEEGKLMAVAPHEELLKTSPTYKQMVELQHEGLLAE